MRFLPAVRGIRFFCAALLLVAGSAPAIGGEITAQQAKQILKELKQIRHLLERQQPPSAPAVSPPDSPERVTLKLGNEFSLGRSDAPVTILEFNDLQCPFCSRFQTGAFPEIKKQFIDTGKVRLIVRDMPLEELHPQAMRAAIATRCAGEQGKYWEIVEQLMAHNISLSPQSVDQLVLAAGVDAARYSSCMESTRHFDAIQEQIASGRAIGINGTPSFVVGRTVGDTLSGVKLIGALPFSAFETAILRALPK